MDQRYDGFEAEYEGITLRGDVEEGQLTAHKPSGEEISSILDGENERVEQISNRIYELAQDGNSGHQTGEVHFYRSESKESYDLPDLQHLPTTVEFTFKELAPRTS